MRDFSSSVYIHHQYTSMLNLGAQLPVREKRTCVQYEGLKKLFFIIPRY